MADIVRLGFVGAGGIAREHAKGILEMEGVSIVGVTDSNADAAQSLAEFVGGSVYPSSSSLIQDAGIDALFTFVPPFARGAAESEAIAARIPFFSEKPLGLDAGYLTEMASEIETAGLLTSVGYMTRYRRSVQRVKELMTEEAPILAYGGWWSGTPGAHPWWTDKSKSGGQFHEQATHTVDLARYLFGDAVEVYAAGAKGFNKGVPDYTMDDAVTVAIRFHSGGVANLMSSCSSNAWGGIFLNVHSLNRSIEFTDWRHSVVIRTKGEDAEEIIGEDGIFAVEDAVFIDAVRTGNRSGILSSYADGAKSARVSIAANRSLETGMPVSL